MSTQTLEELERALERSGDADEALRETVRIVVEGPGIEWAGIAFLDEGVLTEGPSAGVADEERRLRVPVVYQGNAVGELRVDGDADRAFLERVAELVAAHVLIGWDTGGEPWEP
jgi:hypothetical protein